jgi:hypothetical protein
MENLGIFYDHLVYLTAIGNILWPFGIFCGHLVYFPPFWYFVPRKIWQPGWRAAVGDKIQKLSSVGRLPLSQVVIRVARFSLVQRTKTVKFIPNHPKIYQTVIKIPNVSKK